MPLKTAENSQCKEGFGGETGIRTLGTLARSLVFKTSAFDHSAISPFIDANSFRQMRDIK